MYEELMFAPTKLFIVWQDFFSGVGVAFAPNYFSPPPPPPSLWRSHIASD